MKRIAAFLLALLFATPALAQQQVFPPNTVWGRLGAGQPGPGQAIPFATLQASLFGNLFGAGTKNTFLGDVYFGSGRPFCDPIAYGAVPDGNTNSLAAFNACLTALGGNGGTITLESLPGVGGVYCLKAASQGGIFNINVPVRIMAAPGITVSSCGSGFSVMQVSAISILDGFQILGPGFDGSATFGASEPALILANGANGTKLYNMIVYGGSPTIQWNCPECQAYNVNAAFAYAGNASGIIAEWYVQGGGGELYNVSADDNEYPYGTPTPPFTYTAWATNQSVATNAVRTATCQDGNSYVIQAKVGGTTASSGAGPICKNYGGNSQVFTDGTVQWSLSHPTLLNHWQFDTGATDVHIHQADTGGGNIGFALTNTLSGAAPSAITCVTCNGGVSYSAQVDGIAGGQQIAFVSDNFASCLSTGCYVMKFESTFGGGVSITGGQANEGQNGISIAGGSNYTITGVNLTGNGTALSVSGATSLVTATGNNVNGATTGLSLTGTADEVIFTNNVGCVNGATTCVVNTSSGTHNVTSPNDGGNAFAVLVGSTLVNNGSSGCALFETSGVLRCTGNLTADSGGDLTSAATIQALALTSPALHGLSNQIVIDTGTGSPSGDLLILRTSTTGKVLVNTGTGTGTATLQIGNSDIGNLAFANATSGLVTIAPPTGALGSAVNTLQDVSDTFVYRATADTLLNKTLTSPAMTNPTVTGSFTATGLVTNADLVSASITVGGATCTLGGSCSPGAGAIAVGDSLTGGTPNGLLYNSANTIGNLATGNNGVLVTSAGGVPSISTTLPSGIAATNMALTTPTLGVAAGTSLALGGCTIGSQALCETGAASLNGVETILSGGNIGFGTETNPQATFVFSKNAATGNASVSANGVNYVGVDGQNAGFTALAYNGNPNNNFMRSNGTAASPTAVVATNILGALNFSGYNGSTFSNGVSVQAISTDSFSGGTTTGGYLKINATPAGTTGVAQAMRIQAGVIIGAGTTDPGAGNVSVGGNINVIGYIQPNMAATLTCGSGCGSVTGNPQKFSVTTGTAQTSVTVNFGVTWPATPVCAISSNSTASVVDVSSKSTTAITFGASVALTGANIDVLCD